MQATGLVSCTCSGHGRCGEARLHGGRDCKCKASYVTGALDTCCTVAAAKPIMACQDAWWQHQAVRARAARHCHRMHALRQRKLAGRKQRIRVPYLARHSQSCLCCIIWSCLSCNIKAQVQVQPLVHSFALGRQVLPKQERDGMLTDAFWEACSRPSTHELFAGFPVYHYSSFSARDQARDPRMGRLVSSLGWACKLTNIGEQAQRCQAAGQLDNVP